MAKVRERRYFNVEMRAEGDARKMVGHAALFDSPSQDLGGFIEVIKRGAFKKTIQESDVRALWNHDDNFVLGRTKSGTLKLAEDEHGLVVEIDPPDTTWARDLAVSMERGDVDQMSFAFSVVKENWTRGADGTTLREIHEARLYDVSPVTYPAYEDTRIALRKHLEEKELTEEEKIALKDILGHGAEERAEPPPAGHSVELLRMRLELAERF